MTNSIYSRSLRLVALLLPTLAVASSALVISAVRPVRPVVGVEEPSVQPSPRPEVAPRVTELPPVFIEARVPAKAQPQAKKAEAVWECTNRNTYDGVPPHLRVRTVGKSRVVVCGFKS